MKSVYISFFLLLPGITLFGQKVTPGISSAEFRTKVPGIVPEKTLYNEDLSRDEKLGAFEGTWYFDFGQDTLQSVYYSDNLGSKPGPGYVSTFAKYYSYFSKDMGKPVKSFMNRDTVLPGDRKRVENSDTMFFGMWNSKNTTIAMGIYHTGNYKVKKDPSDMVSQNMNAAPERDYYVFSIRCLPQKNPSTPDAWKFYPGMHINEFSKLFPELFPNGLGVNGQFSAPEKKMGLSGNRSYTFKSDKLDWTNWNYYAGNCEETTFYNLQRTTNGIIAEYTKVHGKPTDMNNNLKYNKNNKVNPAMGELRAVWDKGTYTVEISYRSFSGKGMCDLVINIEEKLK